MDRERDSGLEEPPLWEHGEPGKELVSYRLAFCHLSEKRAGGREPGQRKAQHPQPVSHNHIILHNQEIISPSRRLLTLQL